MALNFRQTGPANEVKAALDALAGLSSDEASVRDNASESLATYGAAKVEAVVQSSGWKVAPLPSSDEG